MMTPTVHLNGTHGPQLLAENMAAIDALRAAYAILVEAAPNARDYYPQGHGSFSLARGQHQKRVSDLYAIMKETQKIVESVQDQIDAIERPFA